MESRRLRARSLCCVEVANKLRLSRAVIERSMPPVAVSLSRKPRALVATPRSLKIAREGALLPPACLKEFAVESVFFLIAHNEP